MARRSRSRFTRPAPSTKVWLTGLTLDRQTIAANTRILNLVLNASGLALRPFTVLRTRLELMWTSDQTTATEMPFGAMGFGVVSDVASGVGAAAVPDPITDADFDWLAYQGLLNQFTFLDATGVVGDAGHHYTVDSKAMRKVGQADDLIMVTSNADPAVGATISMVGRILVKLH